MVRFMAAVRHRRAPVAGWLVLLAALAPGARGDSVLIGSGSFNWEVMGLTNDPEQWADAVFLQVRAVPALNSSAEYLFRSPALTAADVGVVRMATAATDPLGFAPTAAELTNGTDGLIHINRLSARYFNGGVVTGGGGSFTQKESFLLDGPAVDLAGHTISAIGLRLDSFEVVARGNVSWYTNGIHIAGRATLLFYEEVPSTGGVNAAPLPAAAYGGMTLLGGLAARRRRTR